MEKKFKTSDKSTLSKLIYSVVIAILCITAIVVGIVSSASKSKDNLPDNPPVDSTPENNPPADDTPITPPDETKKELAFVSPLVGQVGNTHDLTTPVFSETLNEWKVHTGIDIMCEAGANVYASEAGTVSAIYSDPMFGHTVEISHEGNIKTRYSNLDPSKEISFKVGDTVSSGDLIGVVGDSSISELAIEPHVHFELMVGGVKMNPLDYITPESKSTSLGLTE